MQATGKISLQNITKKQAFVDSVLLPFVELSPHNSELLFTKKAINAWKQNDTGMLHPFGAKQAIKEYMTGSGRFEKAPDGAKGVCFRSHSGQGWTFALFNAENQIITLWDGSIAPTLLTPAGHTPGEVIGFNGDIPMYSLADSAMIFGTEQWDKWYSGGGGVSKIFPQGGEARALLFLQRGGIYNEIDEMKYESTNSLAFAYSSREEGDLILVICSEECTQVRFNKVVFELVGANQKPEDLTPTLPPTDNYLEPDNGYIIVVHDSKPEEMAYYGDDQASLIFGREDWDNWKQNTNLSKLAPTNGKDRALAFLSPKGLLLEDNRIARSNTAFSFAFPGRQDNDPVFAVYNKDLTKVLFRRKSSTETNRATQSILVAKLRAFVVEPTPSREQALALGLPVLVSAVLAFYMTRRGRASAEAAAKAVGSACCPSERPLSKRNRAYLQQAQLVTAMSVPASAVFRGATGKKRKDARVACRIVQEMLGKGQIPQHRTIASLVASLASILPFVWYSDTRKRAGLVAFTGWALLVGGGFMLRRHKKASEERWRDTLQKLNVYFEAEGMPTIDSTPGEELDETTQAIARMLGRDGVIRGTTTAIQRARAMRIIRREMGVQLPLSAVLDERMKPRKGPVLYEAVIAFVQARQRAIGAVEKVVHDTIKDEEGEGNKRRKRVPQQISIVAPA
jgi:hypothetical protein